MQGLILLVICIATTTFIGWNVVSLLSARKGGIRLFFFETMGLSYLFGIGLVTVQMFIIGLLKIGFTRFNILLPWVLVAAANLTMRLVRGGEPQRGHLAGTGVSMRKYSHRNTCPRTPPSLRTRVTEIILISLIALQTLYNFFRALIKPIEAYDSVAIYALKSKIMYLAGGLPADFFRNLTSNFHGAHADYPLLIPLSETWLYTFLGRFDDFLAKAIFPLFYLSFIFIFYAVLKRITKNRSLSLLFTFFLASIKQFSDYSTIGVADMELGIYFAISLFYLYLWFARRENTHFLNISLISSILCLWTKNEGMLLALISLFILIVHIFSSIKNTAKVDFARVIIYICIVLFLVVAWNSFKNYHGLVNENFNLSMVNIKNLISGLNKIPAILYGYQKEFFGFKKWNILWILFMGAFFLEFKKLFLKNTKYIVFAIFLFGLGCLLMYIFSAVEIGYFVRRTASRFLLHILSVVMFLIALVVHERRLLEKFEN